MPHAYSQDSAQSLTDLRKGLGQKTREGTCFTNGYALVLLIAAVKLGVHLYASHHYGRRLLLNDLQTGQNNLRTI